MILNLKRRFFFLENYTNYVCIYSKDYNTLQFNLIFEKELQKYLRK